jgi:hypothetical protein
MAMGRSIAWGILATLGVALGAPAQAARCDASTVAGSGFESVTGARIGGATIPLLEATVEVRLGELVLATAEARDGAFGIDLPPLPPEALLQLRGKAANGEDFIELASHVGTVQQLIDLAADSGVAGFGTVPTLALTPESTARYALVRDLLEGGAPAHECALAALDATLDPDDVRERTAVIKLMIDNGGSVVTARGTSGAGSSTLDTVSDPVLLGQEIAAIESSTPGALAATVALLAEPFCGYFAPEALLIGANAAQRLNTISGEIYRTDDATRGLHSNTFGSEGYAYTCDGSRFDVDFDGTRVSLNYPNKLVDGVVRQVLEERRYISARLTRLDTDVETVALGIEEVVALHYPFEPSLPDAITTISGGRLDLVRQRTAPPFVAVDMVGREYLMGTRLEQQDGGNRQFSDEWLAFGAGGLGSVIIPEGGGVEFTWSIDAGGDLRMVFPTRQVRVIALREEPGAIAALAVVDREDGSRAVSLGWVIERDNVLWPAIDAVPGSYVQNAGRVSIGEIFGSFRFDLLPDRRAPSINTNLGGDTPGMELHWSRTNDTQLVMRHCQGSDGNGGTVSKVILDRDPLPGECGTRYRERRWTLMARAAAPGGDYLWMLEDNRDWYGVDPTTTGLDSPTFSFYRGIPYQLRPLPDVVRIPMTQASTPAPAGMTAPR